VAAERAFLLALGGDCNTPIAAHAVAGDGRVTLRALVSDADGRRRLDGAASGSIVDADALGRAVAERLLARGAGALLGR
jgi:hydroxymethylbilane synthase